MEEKKKRKIKHTNLVVPGQKIEGKKLKVKQTHKGVALTSARPGQKLNKDDVQEKKAEVALPSGVIPPKPKEARRKKGRKKTTVFPGSNPEVENIKKPSPKKPKLSPARKRRRRRYIMMSIIAALIGLVVLFFTSGAYLSVATAISGGMTSLSIALQPGEGFPMDFAMIEYKKSEQMSDDGFVALGSQEMVMVSSTGRILRNIPHSYIQPGISSGDNRVVLYNRGSKEYTIEGYDDTITTQVTEHDIQFCEMSPGGSIAVVTASRHRTFLDVYNPPYDTSEPDFSWPIVDENPIAATFGPDNRSLTVATVSAQGGELGTTLYFLHTNSEEVGATVRANGSVLLQIEHIGRGQILAVYDTFSAVYDQDGAELYRYDYSGRRLLTADISDAGLALVFGTSTGEIVHTVWVSSLMEEVYENVAHAAGTAKVMGTENGVFLLVGQEMFVYNSTGQLSAQVEYEDLALGFAKAGTQPLLVTMGTVIPIEDYLYAEPMQSSSSASDAPQITSVVQSVSPPSSAPQSLPQSLPQSASASDEQ